MSKIKNILLILLVAVGLGVCAEQIPMRTMTTVNSAITHQQPLLQTTTQTYRLVNPLDFVARPHFYLKRLKLQDPDL